MEEKDRVGGVRVATLNLWGRRGAWDERRPVLVEGFRRLRPDLVAFQEAVVGEGYDQVTDILGPDYHLAHQTGRKAGRGGDIEDGQGISIASRWPLGEVLEPDLNVTPRTEPPAQLAAHLRARARTSDGNRCAGHRGARKGA